MLSRHRINVWINGWHFPRSFHDYSPMFLWKLVLFDASLQNIAFWFGPEYRTCFSWRVLCGKESIQKESNSGLSRSINNFRDNGREGRTSHTIGDICFKMPFPTRFVFCAGASNHRIEFSRQSMWNSRTLKHALIQMTCSFSIDKLVVKSSIGSLSLYRTKHMEELIWYRKNLRATPNVILEDSRSLRLLFLLRYINM